MATKKALSIRLNSLALLAVEEYAEANKLSLSEAVNKLVVLAKGDTSKKLDRLVYQTDEIISKVKDTGACVVGFEEKTNTELQDIKGQIKDQWKVLKILLSHNQPGVKKIIQDATGGNP